MALETSEKVKLEERVIEKLKTVYDPEIPVNIFDLGLIYEITVNDDAEVHVLMTLTAPNCPAAGFLPSAVREKAASAEGVKKARVDVTFDPPWNMGKMTDAAKLELGFM